MILREYLRAKRYPGRFLLAGMNSKGEAVLAYAIMGRSENSRNRVFTLDGNTLRTKAYDENKVEDPSLIIYNAKRENDRYIVLTNGDQSDTIFDALERGESLESALIKRTYEPDAPAYTPRISVLYDKMNGAYCLSIIKKKEDSAEAERKIYSYKAEKGISHVIHT